MTSNDQMRQEVRKLKVFFNTAYSKISDRTGIPRNTFYCWMQGKFNFSQNKLDLINKITKEIEGSNNET